MPDATQTQEPFVPEMSLWDLLFTLQGRIPRRSYWACAVPLEIVLFFDTLALQSGSEQPELALLGLLVLPAVLWPLIAVNVKRWHDLDYSGWMVLLRLLPIVGPIFSFVVLGCGRGTVGSNTYGLDPT